MNENYKKKKKKTKPKQTIIFMQQNHINTEKSNQNSV